MGRALPGVVPRGPSRTLPRLSLPPQEGPPPPPGPRASMAEQKRLAFAIIEFLQGQLQHGGLSPDAQESLEGGSGAGLPGLPRGLPGGAGGPDGPLSPSPPPAVAIQCLETAFGVSVDDRGLAISQKLPDIFEAAAAKVSACGSLSGLG